LSYADMSDQPQLNPEDVSLILDRARRETFSRIGCLYTPDAEGLARGRGTVAFVEFPSGKFLLTARHIITERSHPEEPAVIALVPSDVPDVALDRSSVPQATEFRLVPRESVVWADPKLDVALLRPPGDLVASDAIKWFDGEQGLTTMARIVRRKWKAAETDGAPLACWAFGFPNMGNVPHAASKIEILAAVPVPAYITVMDSQPLTAGGTPTQIQVELDLTPANAQPHRDGGVLATVASHLRSGADRESDAFGGYSGGPLVLVGRDRTCIFATITDGGQLFGRPTLFATGIDDAMRAFRASGGSVR
jgi:hypothetical protein